MTSTFRFGPRWISTSLVLLLALWILRGFLVPLTWAVIIALATWPLYRRFSTWLPQRFSSNGIPLLFTALVTLFVVVVADYVIRAALGGSAAGLGFCWVVLGGLGGLESFGLLGLMIGPVILG